MISSKTIKLHEDEVGFKKFSPLKLELEFIYLSFAILGMGKVRIILVHHSIFFDTQHFQLYPFFFFFVPSFFLFLLQHSLVLVVGWVPPSDVVDFVEVHCHDCGLHAALSLWLSSWWMLRWKWWKKIVFYIYEWSVCVIQIDQSIWTLRIVNPYKLKKL